MGERMNGKTDERKSIPVIARSEATKQSSVLQYSGLLPASRLAVRNDDETYFLDSLLTQRRQKQSLRRAGGLRKISPKDLDLDNPLQAKRSSGQRRDASRLYCPNSEAVELLHSSGDRRKPLLPRAAFASLSCKGLSIRKSFGLLCPNLLKLTTLGRACAKQKTNLQIFKSSNFQMPQAFKYSNSQMPQAYSL
jgi:hypothetical protein